ncbi:hypothetical protein NliqN6_4934 [Naganishia liquefaciens]|uniref:HBS1-like protein N-terminal domain-containing protein n=1 Tax=Naganishia liquefaciens TaxID=104408 RepID=A0A8H3TWR1_9TREE|nr:hypothetical protein NliqN6_4934 [Naganishia liquefaciens]
MSRHRFVKNIDIDEEMAEDSEEEGMSEEDAAALALSFSVAKPLLADLQPPIPDDSIRESLWHYFFDVEKAVSYLRKERQKGIVSPSKPDGPREKSTSIDPASEPRSLSALQRLAASRKAEHEKAKAQQQQQMPEESRPTVPPPQVDAPAKPLSKLAQLAAQRKAARAASGTSKVISGPPNSSSPVPAKAAQGEPGGKPVSKLAQRIAAAKAAKEQAEADNVKMSAMHGSGTTQSSGSHPPIADSRDMDVDSEEQVSPLFTFPSQLERDLPGKHKSVPTSVFFSSSTETGPSEFFTLLTTTPRICRALPGDPQQEALAKRRRRSEPGRDPFDELDPDEAVMKAREGTRLAPGAVKRT